MILLWIGFLALVLVLLAIDLGVINRGGGTIRPRRALLMTAGTVLMALAFAVFVYHLYDRHWFGMGLAPSPGGAEGSGGADAPPAVTLTGARAAVLFLTGWVVEYSLSVDNLFVILVIFTHFKVPGKYQHRVLFWGILGALVMRGAMIAGGTALVHSFDWILYVFGGILFLTAVRLLLSKETEHDPDRSLAMRVVKRFVPLVDYYEGDKFFTRRSAETGGGLAGTPLFLALVVVETTDVIFAVDSIPAVFAITTEPFIVFTSNVFAILGLRSLFFAISSLVDKFRFLKLSLVFVLGFISLKMLAHGLVPIDATLSLAVVVGILAAGIGASIFLAPPRTAEGAPAAAPIDGGVAPVEQLALAAEATWRRARRWFILLIGVTVFLFGLIVGILPGVPGIPIMFVALMILATEFVWAQRWLKRFKTDAERLAKAAGRELTKPRSLAFWTWFRKGPTGPA